MQQLLSSFAIKHLLLMGKTFVKNTSYRNSRQWIFSQHKNILIFPKWVCDMENLILECADCFNMLDGGKR